MKLAVAIPVKPFHLAKTRLHPRLDAAARQELAIAMLRHVMGVVMDSNVGVVRGLISADPAALALARTHGFEVIPESEPQGYNWAALRARAWAQSLGCDALLILPSDLPLLTANDLQSINFLAEARPRAVVIAPDAAETGVNALLLRPPGVIPPSFGLMSFQRHQLLARRACVSTAIYRSPGFANDIDLPAHLALLP